MVIKPWGPDEHNSHLVEARTDIKLQVTKHQLYLQVLQENNHSVLQRLHLVRRGPQYTHFAVLWAPEKIYCSKSVQHNKFPAAGSSIVKWFFWFLQESKKMLLQWGMCFSVLQWLFTNKSTQTIFKKPLRWCLSNQCKIHPCPAHVSVSLSMSMSMSMYRTKKERRVEGGEGIKSSK